MWWFVLLCDSLKSSCVVCIQCTETMKVVDAFADGLTCTFCFSMFNPLFFFIFLLFSVLFRLSLSYTSLSLLPGSVVSCHAIDGCWLTECVIPMFGRLGRPLLVIVPQWPLLMKPESAMCRLILMTVMLTLKYELWPTWSSVAMDIKGRSAFGKEKGPCHWCVCVRARLSKSPCLSSSSCDYSRAQASLLQMVLLVGHYPKN